MFNLSNKKALITGGSKGIGAAIAKLFATQGAEIVITYNSSPEKADEVIADIEANGGTVHKIKLDGSKAEKADKVVQDAVKYLGHIDILVNNAGTGKEAKIGTDDASLENFDHVNNVNVRLLYAVTQEAVKHMKDGGRIINISSILGERAIYPDIGIYNASKFAVTGLTRSWALDLGERNIRVNAVQPGPIDTDLNPADGSDMGNITALKRYGKPKEVAAAVLFLASDEASYITGATLNVDGGANA